MVDYCPKEPSSPDLCASFIYKNKGQSCNLTHLGRRALGTGGGTHLSHILRHVTDGIAIRASFSWISL